MFAPRVLTACGLLAALAASPSASAQPSIFHVFIDGAQETPPTGSTHTGVGSCQFDPATGVLKYDITITGVTGAFTVAHLHRGAPSVPAGTIMFPLAGGPTTFTGSSVIAAPADVALLLSGRTYFNFHSTVNPGGDIRGQCVPTNELEVAVLTSAKEIPPTGTGATGTFTCTINPGNTITYSGVATGLTGPMTLAHIHDGGPGVGAGAILVPLTITGPGTVGGTTGPVSTLTLAKMRAGLAYVNYHTGAFPAGEIRGQTVPSFVRYGSSCHLGGTAALSGTGVPTPGSALTVDITGGVPGGTGLLFLGPLGDDLAMGFGCRFHLNPLPFVVPFTLPLDPAGGLSIPIAISPAQAVPQWVQLQFIGMAPSEPGGFYTTNGLGVFVDA